MMNDFLLTEKDLGDRMMDCGKRIADCGLGSGYFGLGGRLGEERGGGSPWGGFGCGGGGGEVGGEVHERDRRRVWRSWRIRMIWEEGRD